MGQVGAVFALEASRLARSNVDWHRLLQLCALTQTLVIDEDGCYDPADFNDGLLLGLKGTMAQAELHFLHARLQGGKLNKAKKGELRFPLPVGFCYDDESHIVFDADEEVRGAVALVFQLFRETSSAYGVVQRFAERRLRFPKRAYGGAWNGKIVWGHLAHARVLGLLKNSSYAGMYVFGRYQYHQKISPEGEVYKPMRAVAMPALRVQLNQPHESWNRVTKALCASGKCDSNALSMKSHSPSGAIKNVILPTVLWQAHWSVVGMSRCFICRISKSRRRNFSGKKPVLLRPSKRLKCWHWRRISRVSGMLLPHMPRTASGCCGYSSKILLSTN